jgi:hypothetical protein
MAAYVELFVDQGTTWSTTINLTDDTTNTPINVSGYSANSQLRKSYYSANITANITCAFSNTANGELRLTMDANTTANIRAGRYVFDVKTTDQYNTVSRVLEGIITILPQVTR